MKKIGILLIYILVCKVSISGVILPHGNNIEYLITNDEKYLIEINGKILKIFNHQSKSYLNEIIFSSTITKSQISPNCKFLVIANEINVSLINLEKAEIEESWKEHGSSITDFKFSSNSELLISSSNDNTAIVFDLTKKKMRFKLLGHKNGIYSIDISPDNHYCSTSSSDMTTRIWNLMNGDQTKVLVHTSSVIQSQFSPSGADLITLCQDDTLRNWDFKTGKISAKISFDLESHDWIKKFKWSNSGKYIVAMTGQLTPEIIIYDFEHKRIQSRTFGMTEWAFDFGITSNDKYFYIYGENSYRIGDLNSGRELHIGDQFKACTNEYIYTTTNQGNLFKYKLKDLDIIDDGFFYVLLESRPRIFLISCAADKYNPPLTNLQNCKSDAARIIKYFEKSNELEKQIEEIKALITKNENFSQKAKLDSLQFLLSKTPVLISERLYDYDLDKNSLIKAFNNVKNQMRFEDAFVFHFSGMGGKIKNSELSTLFFSSDTSSFTANDLFQLSEIINGNNQLFLLDACQDNFVNQFKSEILNNKINSQLINRNRIVLAIKDIAEDNYKGTGGGALTYAFINNIAPFNQVFSYNNREKNEYDYNLYNGTRELKEDKSLNFEVFRESDYYDVKFKEKNNRRGAVVTFAENKEVEKPNTISKGQTLSVVVGINAYLNLTTLTNPLIDAEKISTILKEKYGHKVILLKDINYSNLADSLYAIQEKYEFEEGSQFLFYFAGHGGFNKYDNSSCLLLRDSKLNSSGTFDNAMTSATLKGLINQIKSTRTMVVIDACHSRKLTDDCKEAECMALDQSKKFDDKVLDSYLKSPGKVIFTSANVFQEASDGDPFQYSPFANAFISSLNERSLKKIEFDSKAVYKDMLKYQSDKTKNKNFQSEMKYCSYNESNKDDDRFIFIPK